MNITQEEALEHLQNIQKQLYQLQGCSTTDKRPVQQYLNKTKYSFSRKKRLRELSEAQKKNKKRKLWSSLENLVCGKGCIVYKDGSPYANIPDMVFLVIIEFLEVQEVLNLRPISKPMCSLVHLSDVNVWNRPSHCIFKMGESGLEAHFMRRILVRMMHHPRATLQKKEDLYAIYMNAIRTQTYRDLLFPLGRLQKICISCSFIFITLFPNA